MYPETIDKKTESVLAKIKNLPWIKNFYLAGGTTLSLQLGHRESIDLDFFSAVEFSVSKIKADLPKIGALVVDYEEEGTLSGTLDGVKISFFHYDYDRLFPLADFGGIFLADERDIAAMKIDTLSARGSKKDFIDLYFLMKKYRLEEIINFFETKYRNIRYNKMHILKSLVYFDDAENDPEPMMHADFDWKAAKKEIEKQVKNIQAEN